MKDFSKLITELNKMAIEELDYQKPSKPKFKCTSGDHTSNLAATKVGDKCICNGIWNINI